MAAVLVLVADLVCLAIVPSISLHTARRPAIVRNIANPLFDATLVSNCGVVVEHSQLLLLLPLRLIEALTACICCVSPPIFVVVVAVDSPPANGSAGNISAQEHINSCNQHQNNNTEGPWLEQFGYLVFVFCLCGLGWVGIFFLKNLLY